MKTEEQRLLDELYDRENRGSIEFTGNVEVNGQKLPDPKKHQLVSFIKSGIRILGYMLIPFDLLWSAGILVLSEVVGIIEELV